MPKSRGNNEGSFYQHADGRWIVQVTVAGKRLSRSVKSRDEAIQKLAELQGQQFKGTLALPTDVTLERWVEQWLALAEPDLRPSTLAMYRKTLTYVTRIAGSKRLDNLTPLLLTQVFAQLQRETAARRQLALAHGYLNACLQRAVDLNLLAVNPMVKVPKPKWQPRQRQYWDVKQTRRFIETALSEPLHWHPLFVFLVTTGLRFSEAMGLTWADVDWETRQVRVERALVWAGKEYHLVPPKTKAGRRVVSLPEPAVGALRLLPRPTDSTLPIFRTTLGHVPKQGHLRAPLQRLCDKAAVPYLNVHGLRHVAATLAIKATHDAHAVQRRLGHSHVSITMGIYAYALQDDAEVSDAVDALLSVSRKQASV